MQADIIVEDTRWSVAGLARLAEAAGAAVAAHCALPEAAAFSLLACDDARIATLNADFRGRAQPTNVLSWPEAELAAEEDGTRPDPPDADITGEIFLGDIAIAYETCAREAQAQGKTLEAHATHLVIHGLLHLLGYDHERDLDATLMEGIETEILGKLGLPDPYSEGDAG